LKIVSKKRKKQRSMPAQRESPLPTVVTSKGNRIIGRGGSLDSTVVTSKGSRIVGRGGSLDSTIAAESIKAEVLPAGEIVSSAKIPKLDHIKPAVVRFDTGTIRAGNLADLLGDKSAKELEERLAKMPETVASRVGSIEVPPELKERVLTIGENLMRQRAREAVTLPPSPQPPYREEKSKRKSRRVSAREQIAKRVFKRQRQAVVAFLKRAHLKDELDELGRVEAEVAKGSKRSCMHAAYSARVLLEGLADHLFPPISGKRKSRDGQVRALGAKDFKNRLIAYVEERLKGQLDAADFRAFVGTLDAVMNWTGGGPHGSHKPQDAEHLYTRMLDALSVIARAHAAQ
jgi:hypothetical protein